MFLPDSRRLAATAASFMLGSHLLCPNLAADGVHFGPKAIDRSVVSMDQTALIVAGTNRTSIVVRTGLRDAPKGAAWFMPVPARPRDVRTVEDPFPALDRLTAPVAFAMQGRGGGDDTMAASRARDSGVVVDTRVILGVMDVAVLRADTPDVLVQWLDREGFRAPDGARDVFRGYVDRGWWWIAVKLVGDAKDSASIPKPLAFVYDAPAVYPMTISKLSADRFTDVLLFVVAAGRTTVLGPHGGPMAEADVHIDRSRPGHCSAPCVVTQMASPIVAWLDAPTSVAGGRGRGGASTTEQPGDRWRTHAMLVPLMEAAGLSIPAAGDPAPSPWISRLRLQLTPEEMCWDLAVTASARQTTVDRTWRMSGVRDGSIRTPGRIPGNRAPKHVVSPS